MTIESDLNLGDKVKVTAHSIDGVVSAFWLQKNGLQINVEYVANGEMKDRWFERKELEPSKPIDLATAEANASI